VRKDGRKKERKKMWVRKQRKCKKYELWISPSRKRWVEKKEEIKKKYELWISRTEKKRRKCA
jgi:hypothetical protein